MEAINNLSIYTSFLISCQMQGITLSPWQMEAASLFLDGEERVTIADNIRRSGKTFLTNLILEFDRSIHLILPTLQMSSNYPRVTRDRIWGINHLTDSMGRLFDKAIVDEYPMTGDAEIDRTILSSSTILPSYNKLLLIGSFNYEQEYPWGMKKEEVGEWDK
jgi:hypothetical protein